jgi:hypothetical protein
MVAVFDAAAQTPSRVARPIGHQGAGTTTAVEEQTGCADKMSSRRSPRWHSARGVRMKQMRSSGVAARIVPVLVLGLWLVAVSCGGSSAPSASPTAGGAQRTSAYGVAMQADVRTLAMGVQSYYEDTGNYPTTVTQATVGSYINPWPTNPWTHQPIRAGTAMGDFTYTVGSSGFQLIGHLADGKYVLAP